MSTPLWVVFLVAFATAVLTLEMVQDRKDRKKLREHRRQVRKPRVAKGPQEFQVQGLTIGGTDLR